MRDGEWKLSYTGTDVTFGPADLDVVNLAAPEVSDPDIETDDARRPRADGVAFGVDFRGGQTVTFDLAVCGRDEAATRAAYAKLATAWRGDGIRTQPGAVAALYTRRGGSTRVAFGRPRRFAGNVEHVHQGLITAVCDFACADDRWYDADEQTREVALVPAPSGGLLSPLASPLATTRTSDRSFVIDVGGDLPAWPVIEVTGPIVTPVVEVVGRWSVGLTTHLAFDQTAVIDTRPWARSVFQNGVPIGGTLSRASTRLSKASLPPGRHEVVLRGVSGEGTAVARVRWRDSYSTL